MELMPFSTPAAEVCSEAGTATENAIQTPDSNPYPTDSDTPHPRSKSPDSDSPSDDSMAGTGLISAHGSSSKASIYDFHFQYNRTYHKYCQGEYYMPNDEQERERMDFQYHTIALVLDHQKILAPVQKMDLVLDQGTGTGIWAIDIGDQYPETEVLGIDLSPIQPPWVPPNVRFEIDNFNRPWIRSPGTFDLVHSSLNNGFGLRDWDSFLTESFRCLKPGGWMEAKEITFLPLSDDDSLPNDSAIVTWHEKLHEGATISGANLRLASSDLKSLFEKAGFVNVTVYNFKIPIGTWPKDPKSKEIGLLQRVALLEGLHAFSLTIFRQFLKWSKEDLEIFLKGVSRELINRAYHWYWPFFVVYGQKPIEYSVPP